MIFFLKNTDFIYSKHICDLRSRYDKPDSLIGFKGSGMYLYQGV